MTGQQLKNSILQMAVQGKLVPQDPNDEPASVLLERIRKEKEQLIKEGKIKKEKNPSYIFRGVDNLPYEKVGKNAPVCIADDVPFEIPDTWEWVRFSSVISLQSGQDMTPDCYNDLGIGIPYLTGASNIINGNVLINRWTDCGKAFAYKGNLLITCKGTIGAMAILKEDIVHIARQIMAITPSNALLVSYAQLVLQTLVTSLKSAAKSMIPGISRDDVLSSLLPLPPLNEQQRIVDKFQSLIPMLEQYNASEIKLSNLNTGFSNLLKKSILQEAVRGKLVPQDPTDEPASVLLERIRAEKEQLIKTGKIKRDKHESVIFKRDNSHYEKLDGIERCIDDEIPFEIPDSWCWTRLGTMIGVQRGASPRPKGSPEYWSSERTPHHWIKISDITKYTLNDTLYDTDEFLTDLGTTKSVFVDNDYLITAASGSLGKISKLNISGYIYDGLMCMCFKNTSLEMDYIIILIQAMVEYLISLSTGTAWKNITTDILKNLLIPLPPLSEQRRIVEKQRELFDKITLI